MKPMRRRSFLQVVAVGATAPIWDGGVLLARSKAASLLEKMTLEEKIGQLICGQMGDPKLEEHLSRGRIGTLIGLLASKGSAKAAAEYLNRFQAVAKYPVLCVGEQEHGSARNFAGGTEFPAYMALGATRSRELAYLFGKVNTLEARAVGYKWISCPTLDVNIEPTNPIINTRALSDRPELVSALGVESCRGIVANKGVTCICHFPGHGATSRDSHVELPVVERTRAELMAVELAPYRVGIRAGHMNCIMTAHNSYPALEGERDVPATVSKKIMTDLLRKQMGYKGLIATDSLGMKAISDRYSPGDAAVKSVVAGCDILLSYQVEAASAGLRQAVENGTISMGRLDESVLRILEAKFWTGLFDSPQVDLDQVEQVVGCAAHREAAQRIARQAITVIRKSGFPLPKQRGALVISTASWNDLGPAHPEADNLVLSEVKARVPTAQGIFPSAKNASDRSWIEALAASQRAESVILAVATKIRDYTPASVEANRRLFQLMERVSQLGKPVALMVLGNPYAVAQAPTVPVCLCAYSNCPMSVKAAVEVLFGEAKATGRLPVTISRAYQFGLGL